MCRAVCSERGSALFLAMIIVLVIAAIGVTYLTITLRINRSVFNAAEGEAAFAIAESGIDDAIHEINSGIDSGGDGIGNVTGSIDGGTYSVAISPPYAGAGTYTLTSVGSRGEARGLTVVIGPETAAGMAFAAFGDEWAHVDSNGLTDSYDFSVGSYSSQASNKLKGQSYANTKGHVGSNGYITLDSNAKVMGNASPGPGESVTMTSNSYVWGSTAPASSPVVLPPIVLPPVATAPAQTFSISSKDSASFPSGNYHFDSFVTDSNSSVVIKGPAVIVADYWETNSNSKVIFDTSAGPVELYCTGTFKIDSNASVASNSLNPANLRISITTDNINTSDEVRLDSNSNLYGVVYAPNAHIVLSSNAELYGSMTAKRLDVKSNFRFHYDENLSAALQGRLVYRMRMMQEFVPDVSTHSTGEKTYTGFTNQIP